jgi:hypothetical protein
VGHRKRLGYTWVACDSQNSISNPMSIIIEIEIAMLVLPHRASQLLQALTGAAVVGQSGFDSGSCNAVVERR